MAVAQTSITSYYQLQDEGKIGTQQSAILQLIRRNRTLCNRDIAMLLNMEIGSVTGRVNELAKAGLIRAWAVKTDTRTNRRVKIWEVAE